VNVFRRRRIEAAVDNVEAAVRALLVQASRLLLDGEQPGRELLGLMQNADVTAVAADVVRAQAMVLSGLCLDFAKEDEHARHRCDAKHSETVGTEAVFPGNSMSERACHGEADLDGKVRRMRPSASASPVPQQPGACAGAQAPSGRIAPGIHERPEARLREGQS
jgi:hypothetical protein